MAQHRADEGGRHDSGQTSHNPQSGNGGKHSDKTAKDWTWSDNWAKSDPPKPGSK